MLKQINLGEMDQYDKHDKITNTEVKTKAIKNNSFTVLNQPKCIANLSTQQMHFKMNLEIYQTQKVI